MTASLRSARSLRSLFRRSCPPRGCVQRGGAPPLSPVRSNICDGVRQPRQTRKFSAPSCSRPCPRQLPVSAAANDRLAPLGALAPLAFPTAIPPPTSRHPQMLKTRFARPSPALRRPCAGSRKFVSLRTVRYGHPRGYPRRGKKAPPALPRAPLPLAIPSSFLFLMSNFKYLSLCQSILV